LKRAALLWLGFVAIVCAFGGGSAKPAYAATLLNKTLKVFSINFVVTPSPTPIGFVAPQHKTPANIAQATALTANPYGGPVRVAMGPSAYDVPMFGPQPPMVLAQSSPQGAVPVQFIAKPDPNATFLHFVPHQTTLFAGYGLNPTYICAFEIYGFMTSTWKIVDWGFNTVASGTGTFPIENLPATSFLSWFAEGVSTTTKTVYNGGSPGEVTFNGVANVSQQHCIDLTLNVPASTPAGTYTASIQYTLQYLF
jgi:hypothetical protein